MAQQVIDRGESVTLTKFDKQQEGLQKFLTIFARSDAAHDLNGAFSFDNTSELYIDPSIFAEGLPEGDIKTQPWRIDPLYYNEDQVLNSVILQIDKKNDKASENLNDICHELNDPNKKIASEPAQIDVGYSFLGNDFNTLYKYTVCKTYITTTKESTKGDVAEFFKIHSDKEKYDADFGRKFYEDTELGGGDLSKKIGFVIDFALHQFLKKLNNNDPTTPQYYSLVTNAVLNDPASKANPCDRTIFNNNVHSLIETTSKDTYFTQFDPLNPNINNNFYSRYDLVLSKIIESFKGPKDITFKTNLIVTSAQATKNTNENNEPSSRIQNSNSTVIKSINEIKDKLIYYWKTKAKPALKNKLTVQFNSKCQEKRIGDSGQALSCCDIKDKTFKEILPNSTLTFTINDEFVNYYVSHDRLAVAYALLLGLNVIYFDYFGRIFVFKNMYYFGREDLPYKEVQIVNHTINSKDVFDSYFNYANFFNQTLSKKFDNENISDPYSYPLINQNYMDNSLLTDPKDKIIDRLKNIFKLAVTAQFIKINIPNISKEEIDICQDIYNKIKSIEPMIDINNLVISVNSASKTVNLSSKDINQLNDFLNRIGSIYNKFGAYDVINDKNKEKVLTTVNNWIKKNIQKMEFFKVIDDIEKSLTPGQQERRSPRILQLTNLLLGTQNNDVSTDKYIFLPYIQNLDTEIKTEVIQKLVNIKNDMNEFINSKLQDPQLEPGVRKTRTWYQDIIKRPNPQVKNNSDFIFYTNTINLLAESTIFLSYNNEHITATIGGGDGELDELEAFENYDDEIINEDLESISLQQFYLPDLSTELEDSEEMKSVNNVPKYTDNGDTSSSDIIIGNQNNNLKGGKAIGEQFSISNHSSNIITDFNIFHITWPYLKYNLMLSLDLVRGNKFKEIMGKIKISRIFRQLGRNQNNNDYGLSDLLNLNGGSNKNESFKSFIGGGSEDEIKEFIASKEFQEDFEDFKILDSEELVNDPNNNNLIITDHSLCYHPLLPIYMLLTAFYYSLDTKFDSNPFNASYITYYFILEKITDVIITNYLVNPTDNNNVKNACVIGLGLGYMLIMAPNEFLNIIKIVNLANDEVIEYFDNSFIPISSSLSFSVLSGATFIENQNIPYAYIILRSLIFKEFIDKLNIIEIITDDQKVLKYELLREKIFNLMSTINDKVTHDRNIKDINVILTPEENLKDVQKPEYIENKSPSSPVSVGSISNLLSPEANNNEYSENKSLSSPVSADLLQPLQLFKQPLTPLEKIKIEGGNKTYKKKRNKRRITIKKNKNYIKKTIKHKRIKKNKNYIKKTIKHKRIKKITRMLKLKVN